MSGRAVGTARTRERLLAVATDHFVRRSYDEVTLAEVAREAGVTQQTLLNHFSSKEGLFLAYVGAMGEEIQALRGRPAPGDVAAAARAVVRQYERFGDANVRAAPLAERLPVLRQLRDQGRAFHQTWLEEVFAAQLPGDPGSRRRTVARLYVATDVHTWHVLRRELNHSLAETTALIESMLRAALTADS